MKFPYWMLRDFIDTRLSAEEVGDLLTMAGFELEGIEVVGGDNVLDIKVMSNRGDGLSVFGLAREVLAKDPEAHSTALYQSGVDRFQSGAGHAPALAASVSIDTQDCTRYACLMLTNISRADSESWMQARLVQAGMRPISLLVDITNYVMLEFGQPLHAFDFDKLAGGRIIVRKARSGETLTTLNGQDHTLQADQMMICDAVKPVAVAGVMGGQETEVSDSTTTVLLESAHFVNTSVRRTRKQLGLNTEASYRFERSVDPEGVVAALYRCVQLVQQADPGVVATAVVDEYPTKPSSKPIDLRVSRASKLLGMAISPEDAGSYLARLGFKPEPIEEGVFRVASPTWRPDIVREIDLIEELGRVHGYERIPERLLDGTTTMGGPQGLQLWTDWLREAALRAGLTQMMSHSLSDLHPLDDPWVPRLGPRSPASPEMAYLRNSLLSSLGEAARRNNPKEVQIFEIGRVFSQDENGYVERIRLGLLAAGPLLPIGWTVKESSSSSFYTLKGVLESAMDGVGVSVRFGSPETLDPRLHPSRQASVFAGDVNIGFLGQLHPDVAKECGLIAETIVAEIAIEAAYEARDLTLKLHSVSRHPSVRRDMSILLDKTVPFEAVAARIAVAGGDVLEKQWLFDVFAGQGIPAGKHALGIAIQLRKLDSTYTDEEANQVRDRVVAALAELGATMR
jgi:phenylalanyl-tRNA synthetase beta chain